MKFESVSKPVLGKYVLKTRLKVGNGDFKSPFFKGGFRGIIKPLYNPPCPPLGKGGVILSQLKFPRIIQGDAGNRFEMTSRAITQLCFPLAGLSPL
jgi:hypothetical protein